MKGERKVDRHVMERMRSVNKSLECNALLTFFKKQYKHRFLRARVSVFKLAQLEDVRAFLVAAQSANT